MNATKFAGMTAEDAAEMARKRLMHLPFQNLSLTVDMPHIWRTNDAWHIPLIPSRPPRRFSALYEELALVAEDISETEGIEVFFFVQDPIGEGAEMPPVEVSNAALV